MPVTRDNPGINPPRPTGWVTLHIVDVHTDRLRALRVRVESVSRYTDPGDAHVVPKSVKSEVRFSHPDGFEWCAETPEEIESLLAAATVPR